MKYCVVGASDPDEFTDMVNAAIEDGWKPIGGVAVTVTVIREEISYWYAQSMTRPISFGATTVDWTVNGNPVRVLQEEKI